jgi:hypothetical protein
MLIKLSHFGTIAVSENYIEQHPTVKQIVMSEIPSSVTIWVQDLNKTRQYIFSDRVAEIQLVQLLDRGDTFLLV